MRIRLSSFSVFSIWMRWLGIRKFTCYLILKPVTVFGGGTGTTVPTRSFYNSFEAGDRRTEDRVGYFYTSYYTNGSGALFDLGAPYIFKYFNTTAFGTLGSPGTGRNDLNVMQIRYAEVLLMYAEAQNELGGAQDPQAYEALKKIRDRANLATPAQGTFTQQTFRDAVLRERWHELCYEGITWFDMVRLRKVYNESTNGFDEFVGPCESELRAGSSGQASAVSYSVSGTAEQSKPRRK